MKSKPILKLTALVLGLALTGSAAFGQQQRLRCPRAHHIARQTLVQPVCQRVYLPRLDRPPAGHGVPAACHQQACLARGDCFVGAPRNVMATVGYRFR